MKNNLTEEFTACTRYLSVNTPSKADAKGLFECIGESLQVIGIEALTEDSVLGVSNMPVLVGGWL